ncbi:MAG: hypothetical protein C0615_02945 [Desulfuromonas sp.]|nr:MAG: hypothetical protein C0615_02945 [Desulfuromonas sp.]
MNLPALTLIRSFFRMFLLQGSWNFERMQNLGVIYIVGPALKRLYQGDDLREAYQRHIGYFNTHPFMAAPVFGAILCLEEKRVAGHDVSFSVEDFKSMIMAPYAAIGDALFWGGVRPLAACTALFFAVKGSLLAPFVMLGCFNIPHLLMRFWGFIQGYSRGVSVVELVQRRRLPDLAIRCKEGTLILLGGLCAYLVFVTCGRHGVEAGWGLLALPIIYIYIWLSRKGLSTLFLTLMTFILVMTLFQVIA